MSRPKTGFSGGLGPARKPPYLASMRRLLFFALLGLAACAPDGDGSGPDAPSVVLDGEFSDWDAAQPLLDDPADAAPGAEVDITRVLARDTPAWLYLSIDLGRDVNIQSMLGGVEILVDADDDPATGARHAGMDGVDFVVGLSPANPAFPGTPGGGFRIGVPGEKEAGPSRSAYDLDVAAAPTAASNRYELRIARGGADDGFGVLGDAVRLKLLHRPAGTVADETEVVRYVFSTAPGPAPTAPSIEPVLRPVEGSFRVAHLNVAGERFVDPADHAALLAAVRPDVILLDEVHGGVTEAFLVDFFRRPALAALGEWSFHLGETGGRQRTVVAARGAEVRPAEALRRVEYAPGSLEPLAEGMPESVSRLVELEKQRDMSATGAWVRVGGSDVLFVPIDFQSGGAAGGPQDRLRMLQARTLKAHIIRELDARTEPAPVVIGGDINLVGSVDPLMILSSGMDVDGSALSTTEAHRLGEASYFTWRAVDGGDYAPGRLDYTLYSDAALVQVGGFAFATDDLSDEQLAELGVPRDLSARTSDHLVVVTDLRHRTR